MIDFPTLKSPETGLNNISGAGSSNGTNQSKGIGFMDVLRNSISEKDKSEYTVHSDTDKKKLKNDDPISNETKIKHNVESTDKNTEDRKTSSCEVKKNESEENSGKKSSIKKIKEKSSDHDEKHTAKISEEDKSDIIKTLELTKSKKTDTIDPADVDGLLQAVENLISMLKTDGESDNKISLKELSEIKKTLLNLKKNRKNLHFSDKNLLKNTISKLESLLSGIDLKNSNTHADIKEQLVLVNSLIEKLSPKKSRNHQQRADVKTAEAADAGKNGTNLNKAIIDSVKTFPDDGQKFSGNEGGSENRNSFSLNTTGKTAAGSSGRNFNSGAPDFKSQLSDMINNAKISVKNSKNASFSVKLFPKTLGSLNLSLGLDQGMIHGKFMVDNIQARDLLMENLSNIKQQLEDAGLTVGEFQVDVRDQKESFNRDNNENKNRPSFSNDSIIVTNEYESNSMALHTGEINMVI